MPASRWMQTKIAAVSFALVLGGYVSEGYAAHTGMWASKADLVKYYEVRASYLGRPENLSEIAERFLGDSSRSNEIFQGNFGRTQPDGGKLTDPNSLHEGWILVLPWDAVGEGVQLGEIPPSRPGSPVAPSSPVTSSRPAQSASSGTSNAPTAGCTRRQGLGTVAVPWAQLRLAPQEVWSHSRGEGVTVAVVDSGVDRSVPQLAGRVAEGVDVADGSGKGNTDCLGSGTAMALLIAAQGDGVAGGMAPGATILPVRVVTDTPSVKTSDQAAAIDVAVSGGATVIALGSSVNLDDPGVKRAIADAANHDVVVVAGAATEAPTFGPFQVVRVGAIDADGQLVQAYAPGGVDVAAPGVVAPSSGPRDASSSHASSTQYAVALVAGEVALLRALSKEMPSGAVIELIESSASPLGTGPIPDLAYGWGLMDPMKAMIFTEQGTSPVDSSSANAARMPAALIIVLVTFAIASLVVLARVRGSILFRQNWRRKLRSDSTDDEPRSHNDDPPVHTGPPGGASTSLRQEFRSAASLPRRIPSARPTMALDGAIASPPAGSLEPDARDGSRSRNHTVELATVRDDLL